MRYLANRYFANPMVEAIKLIRKVGGLMKMQKQLSQFGDYLAELRVQFKRKRNFITLLDGVVRSAAN